MAEQSETQRRTKKLFQAGVSAVFCKAIVLAVNALVVSIVVRYLGALQFGIWVTISSTLALLVLLDLGIASTMTNLISEAYALNDSEKASRYSSTGFWLMVLISIVLGAIGASIWQLIPWGALFHVQDTHLDQVISHAAAAAYVVFLVGLPAGLAAKYLAGYQEIKTANYFSAAGALANLLAIICVSLLHGDIVWLVAASSGAMVITNLICLAWIWLRHKPWLLPSFKYWDKNSVRLMMKSGSEFFILQITGLIVFNSDNFVITHFLGPEQVTPYSVTWKLVGYSAALQIIITPALWPAYSEAYIRKDFLWMRKTLRYVMFSTMSIASACCLLLIIWGRDLIRIWAGATAVPPQALIVLMCIWILISTFMANTATVLMATHETKMQAWLSVAAAILNLISSVILVQRIGPIGVILSTIGSYVLLLIGPQTWKTYQVLRGNIHISHHHPAIVDVIDHIVVDSLGSPIQESITEEAP